MRPAQYALLSNSSKVKKHYIVYAAWPIQLSSIYEWGKVYLLLLHTYGEASSTLKSSPHHLLSKSEMVLSSERLKPFGQPSPYFGERGCMGHVLLCYISSLPWRVENPVSLLLLKKRFAYKTEKPPYCLWLLVAKYFKAALPIASRCQVKLKNEK